MLNQREIRAELERRNQYQVLLFQCVVCVLMQTCGVMSIRTIDPLTASNNEINYINIPHSINLELMQLDSQPNYSDLGYIILELTISANTMQNILTNDAIYPITCYQYNSDPIISVDSIERYEYPCQNGFDYNQYYRANGKYSMIVPTPFGQYSRVMLGIYIESPVSYNVKIRGRFSSFPYDLCPFDCNMGSITKADCTKQKCNCPPGLIDYDCSQPAEEISTSKKYIQLLPQVMTYAYFRPPKLIKSIKEASKITIEMNLLLNTKYQYYVISYSSVQRQILVPNENIASAKFLITHQPIIEILDPIFQYDKQLQPADWVVGYRWNSTTTINTLIIQITSEDSNDPIYVIIFSLVGVIILLFVVLIVIIIIKNKFARRNRVVDMANHQNMIQQEQFPNNIRRQKLQNSKLTAQLIDQSMPVFTFKEILKKQKERGKSFVEACPVCLGEFEETEICRQAICNHYFHKDCIEQWLKKQENCPFCRADLSREALTGMKDSGDSAKPHQTKQFLEQQSTSSNHLRNQQQLQLLQASPILLAPSYPPSNLQINSSPQVSIHNQAAIHFRQILLGKEQLDIIPTIL